VLPCRTASLPRRPHNTKHRSVFDASVFYEDKMKKMKKLLATIILTGKCFVKNTAIVTGVLNYRENRNFL
jgi:hypothetical protein